MSRTTRALALISAAAIGCESSPSTSDAGLDAIVDDRVLDAGPTDAASSDAGPPDCEADPLLPGCVPTERPPFAGLGGEVRIVRDADGVPHVYGETSRDVMYGAGYAQAVDRLFQMDLSRRRALGRRAEVLGEAFVEGDQLVRVVDIPRWGRTNEAALFRDDPETWALLQAWTEGVNARIEEVLDGEAPLPAEFTTLGYLPERWAPSDASASSTPASRSSSRSTACVRRTDRARRQRAWRRAHSARVMPAATVIG